MYFEYGEKEMSYLASKDKTLGEIITKRGFIERETEPDIFTGIVKTIVGQQISTKAQETIYQRILDKLVHITPASIISIPFDELQGMGISKRKATYIQNIAHEILHGRFDTKTLHSLPDAQIIEQLSSLNGVGVWTAEMLMIFSLQRTDVLSYTDLAIQRGLRMLYHHRRITSSLFDKYKKRYSPYGTIASFYLWEVSNGAFPDMKDYAPLKKK